MNLTGYLVLILTSTFTGWIISWAITKFICWPLEPVNITGFKVQGLIPAQRDRFVKTLAQFLQSEFVNYQGLEAMFADPKLLARIRPDIEKHVDVFLNEKLKIAFPLLSQFMGEKTLNQFKSTFMAEIDILFPQTLSKYVGEIKKDIHADAILLEKVNAISTKQICSYVKWSMKRDARNFILACSLGGLLVGCVSMLMGLIVQAVGGS